MKIGGNLLVSDTEKVESVQNFVITLLLLLLFVNYFVIKQSNDGCLPFGARFSTSSICCYNKMDFISAESQIIWFDVVVWL